MRTPLLCLLALAGLATAVPAADRKPNFVYVFTDDQRWDALGVVQTRAGGEGALSLAAHAEPRPTRGRRHPLPQTPSS